MQLLLVLDTAFRKLSVNFQKGHPSKMYTNFITFKYHAKFCNDIYNKNWEFLVQLLIPTKCGQSGKPNFYKLLTNMLRFALACYDRFNIKAMKDPHDWANF